MAEKTCGKATLPECLTEKTRGKQFRRRRCGRKHLSRAEETRRRAVEVQVEQAKTAKPPKWLPPELKAEFRALGKRLIAAGLYTELDADMLGRYLVAQRQYAAAALETGAALDARDQENADGWGKIQERCFKQARNCANDMGLTVTSRCRLVVPESGQKTEENNPFLRLIGRGDVRYG